jgi:hypothetical protein
MLTICNTIMKEQKKNRVSYDLFMLSVLLKEKHQRQSFRNSFLFYFLLSIIADYRQQIATGNCKLVKTQDK